MSRETPFLDSNCALLKAYSRERAISDRLLLICRLDRVRKIRDRKQITDVGNYSFVNRTIKNWNQLPAEALGAFPYKPNIFRNKVRKAIITGVK